MRRAGSHDAGSFHGVDASRKATGSPGLSNSNSIESGIGDTLLSLALDGDQQDALLLTKGPSEENRVRSKRRTTFQMFTLSCYTLGWSGMWTAMLVVLLPRQMSDIAGEGGRGTALGTVMACGGVVSCILPPVVGLVSDRTRTRWGRRRPYMVAGTICCSITILFLPLCSSVATFSLVWVIVQVASNTGSGAFVGLIPDVIQKEQLGEVSGVLGATAALGQLLGSLLGMLTDSIGLGGVYTMLALVHLATTALTVVFTPELPTVGPYNPGQDASDMESPDRESKEEESLEALARSFIAPMRVADFRLVFFSRLLINMGIYSVQEFLQYYVADIVPLEGWSASAEVSVIFLPLLLSGLIAAYVCGKVSDALGGRRKIFVYFSGITMALSTVALIVNRSFALCIMIAVVFGGAFGAFQAVDYALVLDVLPDAQSSAKDLGVWHISLVIPQLIATPIAGAILDGLKASSGAAAGYAAIFSIASVYFLAGTGLVTYIKASK
eukprot:g3302.t1